MKKFSYSQNSFIFQNSTKFSSLFFTSPKFSSLSKYHKIFSYFKILSNSPQFQKCSKFPLISKDETKFSHLLKHPRISSFFSPTKISSFLQFLIPLQFQVKARTIYNYLFFRLLYGNKELLPKKAETIADKWLHESHSFLGKSLIFSFHLSPICRTSWPRSLAQSATSSLLGFERR
jgi:hypothetical protein